MTDMGKRGIDSEPYSCISSTRQFQLTISASKRLDLFVMATRAWVLHSKEETWRIVFQRKTFRWWLSHFVYCLPLGAELTVWIAKTTGVGEKGLRKNDDQTNVSKRKGRRGSSRNNDQNDEMGTVFINTHPAKLRCAALALSCVKTTTLSASRSKLHAKGHSLVNIKRILCEPCHH